MEQLLTRNDIFFDSSKEILPTLREVLQEIPHEEITKSTYNVPYKKCGSLLNMASKIIPNNSVSVDDIGEIIDILLEKGMRLDEKNHKNETPLEKALSVTNPKRTYSIETGIVSNKKIAGEPIIKGNFEIAHILLSKGSPVSDKTIESLNSYKKDLFNPKKANHKPPQESELERFNRMIARLEAVQRLQIEAKKNATPYQYDEEKVEGLEHYFYENHNLDHKYGYNTEIANILQATGLWTNQPVPKANGGWKFSLVNAIRLFHEENNPDNTTSGSLSHPLLPPMPKAPTHHYQS